MYLYYSQKDIGCTEIAKMYYIDILLVILMKFRRYGRETRASERKKRCLFVREKEVQYIMQYSYESKANIVVKSG